MMLSLPFFAVVAFFQARRARRGKLPILTVKDRFQLVFLGFIGYYLSSYLDFLGLQYITAGLERFILFLSPTFVLLISAIDLKRPIITVPWGDLGLTSAAHRVGKGCVSTCRCRWLKVNIKKNT